MSFTNPSVATNNISSLDNQPNDNSGLTAAQVKAAMDKFGVDFMAYFINTHLQELQSIVAGSSGAELIGSATIPGISGNNPHDQIANLLAIAQAAQSGTVLPGTITDTMLSNAAGMIKDSFLKHIKRQQMGVRI